MLLVIVLVALSAGVVGSNRVVELNEKFLEVYLESEEKWLVQFYAPWCHHCKQMEGELELVAQEVHNLDIGVVVGRLDCTKHSSVAHHFSIRGFPSLLFIHRQAVVEFHGERTKDAIVDFVRRQAGPSLVELASCPSLPHSHYFLSTLDSTHPLHSNLTQVAKVMSATNWFYSIPLHKMDASCRSRLNIHSESVFAVKTTQFATKTFAFCVECKEANLKSWLKRQQFPLFTRVTPANFHSLLNSKSYLVLALVEEFPNVRRFASSKHQELVELLEAIGSTFSPNDDSLFLFGFTSHLFLVNHIALSDFSAALPAFLLINSTSLHTFQLQQVEAQNIVQLLKDLRENPHLVKATGGGNSFFTKLQRLLFEVRSSLMSMFRGNPVLTIVIFGLPTSFLAIIVYTSCAPDFLDSDDQEEGQESTSEEHPKRD